MARASHFLRNCIKKKSNVEKGGVGGSLNQQKSDKQKEKRTEEK